MKYIALLIFAILISGCAAPLKHTVLSNKLESSRSYVHVKGFSGVIHRIGNYNVKPDDEVIEINSGNYEITMSCNDKYIAKQKVAVKPIPKTQTFNFKAQYYNYVLGRNGRAMIGFVCHPELHESHCKEYKNECYGS